MIREYGTFLLGDRIPAIAAPQLHDGRKHGRRGERQREGSAARDQPEVAGGATRIRVREPEGPGAGEQAGDEHRLRLSRVRDQRQGHPRPGDSLEGRRFHHPDHRVGGDGHAARTDGIGQIRAGHADDVSAACVCRRGRERRPGARAEPARKPIGADRREQRPQHVVELEGELEGEDEVQQRRRMKQRRRDLAEQRHAAFGPRVPERQAARPQLLGDEELDRVIEPSGIAVVELHTRVQRWREEDRQQREAEEGRRKAQESVARDHDRGHLTGSPPLAREVAGAGQGS